MMNGSTCTLYIMLGLVYYGCRNAELLLRAVLLLIAGGSKI
jgi:hypothetical protein